MRSFITSICLLIGMAVLASCSGRNASATASGATSDGSSAAADSVLYPRADADSLYAYVARQVAFGPRNPGSEAHRQCRDMLENYFGNLLGFKNITVSADPVENFKGERLTAYNILARYNPEATDRLLFAAHYDTRPWADEDADPARRDTPIDGANDGASGVAVLMEIARQLSLNAADSIGVDFLLVDLEDSGESGTGNDESWCLGTQKFIENMPWGNTDRPYLGVLFDMVGGQGATFPREGISLHYARRAVDKIWALAHATGLGRRFPNEAGGAVIDDHLYLNRAGIPCVDIIESANPATGSFNPTWHTTDDSLESIDRHAMADAAQLGINLIYSENKALQR